ncbi:siphovirus Gp157 family protein [Haemophilus parainfluenzae]|uniref:Uncharacterized protein n=1 Tax=Haemophilus parainfluenzae TaxID=729 RepID=A0A377JKQ2_HAEPA|nr:siphovirus Gp157 family protein [Haemophilus parainfluenzae]STP06343.1 Uncharacterised protein [Haemophilus parainfluenzae]
MKLYEITEQLENIKELLENPEFADNADIAKALDAVQQDFDKKRKMSSMSLKIQKATLK